MNLYETHFWAVSLSGPIALHDIDGISEGNKLDLGSLVPAKLEYRVRPIPTV